MKYFFRKRAHKKKISGRRSFLRRIIDFVIFAAVVWLAFTLVGRFLRQVAVEQVSEFTSAKIKAESSDLATRRGVAGGRGGGGGSVMGDVHGATAREARVPTTRQPVRVRERDRIRRRYSETTSLLAELDMCQQPRQVIHSPAERSPRR